MKFLVAGFILFHGLIHLMGFAKAFEFAAIKPLKQDISKTSGLFWLLATMLFIVTAVLLVIENIWWFLPAAVSILVSQYLIINNWRDARYGTIANLIILAVIAVGF